MSHAELVGGYSWMGGPRNGKLVSQPTIAFLGESEIDRQKTHERTKMANTILADITFTRLWYCFLIF